jgi:hypothetical protein
LWLQKKVRQQLFFTPLFCCCFWIRIRVAGSGINIPDPQHWRKLWRLRVNACGNNFMWILNQTLRKADSGLWGLTLEICNRWNKSWGGIGTTSLEFKNLFLELHFRTSMQCCVFRGSKLSSSRFEPKTRPSKKITHFLWFTMVMQTLIPYHS